MVDGVFYMIMNLSPYMIFVVHKCTASTGQLLNSDRHRQALQVVVPGLGEENLRSWLPGTCIL